MPSLRQRRNASADNTKARPKNTVLRVKPDSLWTRVLWAGKVGVNELVLYSLTDELAALDYQLSRIKTLKPGQTPYVFDPRVVSN